MGFILPLLSELDAATVLLLVPTLVVLGHVGYYFLDPHHFRGYPGPLLAKFSDLWLGRIAAQGHRSEVVHELHQKYGELPALTLCPP